jgi:hypothetical protein
MANQDQAAAENPPVGRGIIRSHPAAEYNTPHGLDWARIDAEYQAASTSFERVAGKAAAKAIQRGATTSGARAVGHQAFKAWAEETGEEVPAWVQDATGDTYGEGDDDE